MKLTLHVTDALGRQLSAETTLDELNDTMRALAPIGATSGNLLGSGLTLPYDNEKDFDWTLIGARPWTDPEGNEGVFWQGSFYKRRVFEAKTTGVKMAAAVKYSRGARPTDPEGIKEGDEAGVQYVTLLLFKGGKRQDQWAKKGNTLAQERKPEAPAAPVADALAEFKKVASGTRYYTAEGAAELLGACLKGMYPNGEITFTSLNEALKTSRPEFAEYIVNTTRTWIAEDKAGAA